MLEVEPQPAVPSQSARSDRPPFAPRRSARERLPGVGGGDDRAWRATKASRSARVRSVSSIQSSPSGNRRKRGTPAATGPIHQRADDVEGLLAGGLGDGGGQRIVAGSSGCFQPMFSSGVPIRFARRVLDPAHEAIRSGFPMLFTSQAGGVARRAGKPAGHQKQERGGSLSRAGAPAHADIRRARRGGASPALRERR